MWIGRVTQQLNINGAACLHKVEQICHINIQVSYKIK